MRREQGFMWEVTGASRLTQDGGPVNANPRTRVSAAYPPDGPANAPLRGATRIVVLTGLL